MAKKANGVVVRAETAVIETTVETVEMNQETNVVEPAVETTVENVEINTETITPEIVVETPTVEETPEVVESTEIVEETPEVVESVKNTFTPDSQEYRPMMKTSFVMTPEEELSQEAWDDIQERLDLLNVESIKLVIDYCRDRLEELQREEIEALEAEMRTIQSKLFSMKGGALTASAYVPKKKREKPPIINPANPSEVYRFGRTPDWLKALIISTGKTIEELRG